MYPNLCQELVNIWARIGYGQNQMTKAFIIGYYRRLSVIFSVETVVSKSIDLPPPIVCHTKHTNKRLHSQKMSLPPKG
jgi:hypothetical protein